MLVKKTQITKRSHKYGQVKMGMLCHLNEQPRDICDGNGRKKSPQMKNDS